MKDTWVKLMFSVMCLAIANLYWLNHVKVAAVVWSVCAVVWFANGLVTARQEHQRQRHPTWDEVYGRDRDR